MWCHFNFNLISCVSRQWVSGTAAYTKKNRAQKSRSKSKSTSSDGSGGWMFVGESACVDVGVMTNSTPNCTAPPSSILLGRIQFVHSFIHLFTFIEYAEHWTAISWTIAWMDGSGFSVSPHHRVCVYFKFRINILLIRNVDVQRWCSITVSSLLPWLWSALLLLLLLLLLWSLQGTRCHCLILLLLRLRFYCHSLYSCMSMYESVVCWLAFNTLFLVTVRVTDNRPFRY